jgi:hypothetical protein
LYGIVVHEEKWRKIGRRIANLIKGRKMMFRTMNEIGGEERGHITLSTHTPRNPSMPDRGGRGRMSFFWGDGVKKRHYRERGLLAEKKSMHE